MSATDQHPFEGEEHAPTILSDGGNGPSVVASNICGVASWAMFMGLIVAPSSDEMPILARDRFKAPCAASTAKTSFASKGVLFHFKNLYNANGNHYHYISRMPSRKPP